MLGVDTEFIGVYDLDNAITCGIGLLIRLLREGLDAEFFGLGDGEDSIFAINVSLFFCDLLGGGLDAVFGYVGGSNVCRKITCCKFIFKYRKLIYPY